MQFIANTNTPTNKSNESLLLMNLNCTTHIQIMTESEREKVSE